MATQTGSGTPQAQDSIVAGVSEREKVTVTGTLAAQSSAVSGGSEREIGVFGLTEGGLSPEAGTYGTVTLSYSGDDLVVSGIGATLNGTYAPLPEKGFKVRQDGSLIRAVRDDEYNVYYNDGGADPRAVVFNTKDQKWTVRVLNSSSSVTTWTDNDNVGTTSQNVATVNAPDTIK